MCVPVSFVTANVFNALTAILKFNNENFRSIILVRNSSNPLPQPQQSQLTTLSWKKINR